MKKIFPIIVILISLSLLGIIILQVSWFRNLLLVQKEQLLNKVELATLEVADELSNYASTPSPLRNSRKPSVILQDPDGQMINLFKPQPLSARFSAGDIYRKIRDRFNKKGLQKVDFEFAISTNNNYYTFELQSKHFGGEFLDTIGNKTRIAPIYPQGGSFAEGLVPYESLIVVVPDFEKQVWESITWMVAGAIIFTVIIIAAFFLTVKTLLNQKKLSEIKSDFINNMTHEFKTPLATISLAVDALRNEKVQTNPEKMQYFSGIIKEENKRMNRHVETILQAALMEKQELKLNLQPVHAHAIITDVLENFTLQLEDKKGTCELHLNAKNDVVMVDELHFTNLINNLIDNAVKYAKDNEPLLIKISSSSNNKFFSVRVEDNGIGMNKETVKRIFEKFYRAHTGNVHNVKGFGLGMSYAKTVIDALNGKMKIESTLGKGSAFTVEIPFKK